MGRESDCIRDLKQERRQSINDSPPRFLDAERGASVPGREIGSFEQVFGPAAMKQG
jgi:hypothetical protein